MTLDKLTTPFERRRVIEYGSDGNKVVRHWYDVQQVDGTIYKTRDFPDEQGVPQFKVFMMVCAGSGCPILIGTRWRKSETPPSVTMWIL